jgi:hypothetical protein
MSYAPFRNRGSRRVSVSALPLQLFWRFLGWRAGRRTGVVEAQRPMHNSEFDREGSGPFDSANLMADHCSIGGSAMRGEVRGVAIAGRDW